MTHLLWTLMWHKTYALWKTMRKLTNTDPKTLRKWIDVFSDAIMLIEPDIVSFPSMRWCVYPHWNKKRMAHCIIARFFHPFQIKWSNRHKGDRLNDCLVSVDGTDFQIPYAGKKFHSHKFKFGSGLRYEVAVSILSGDLVWVNGPYEPGIWNDIKIFRNALLSMLGVGERVEADDGYLGEAPAHVKCPKSIGGHDERTEAMQSLVRRRHETVNKRFKQWKILKDVYRGDISNHWRVLRVCAIVTQLAIENGEPLFSVDYEDPDFDNDYFQEEGDDDEDN